MQVHVNIVIKHFTMDCIRLLITSIKRKRVNVLKNVPKNKNNKRIKIVSIGVTRHHMRPYFLNEFIASKRFMTQPLCQETLSCIVFFFKNPIVYCRVKHSPRDGNGAYKAFLLIKLLMVRHRPPRLSADRKTAVTVAVVLFSPSAPKRHFIAQLVAN